MGGMLTFARLRATSNKDIEQAVEQGRTRMPNKDEQVRNAGEQATNKDVEQGCRTRLNKRGSNKVSNKVEQGCRTRTNKVEQGICFI